MTNKNHLKILFVEDVHSDAELAVLELRKEKLQFEYSIVDTRDEFIKVLNDFRPDIVISDYNMPSYNGMQALKVAREFDPLIPFILYTGSINEETAVKCLKAGANDYIIKEQMTRLPFAVKEVLEKHRIQIEKRAALLLLKENEEKLHSIFRVAPVGIGLVVNRIYMEVNDTFCKMTGYSRKELIGRSSVMVFPTIEEFEFVGLEKTRQIAEKGTASVESRLKCNDGRILNIIASATPLDLGDLSKGLTFTVLDITERKQAEDTINRERTVLRTLIDNMPSPISFKDSQGRYILNNTAHLKLIGAGKQEDVIGKTTFDFFPEAEAMEYDKDDKKILSSGEMMLDKEEIAKDRETGETYWHLTDKIPLIDADSKVTHLITISHDITQQKLIEMELKGNQIQLMNALKVAHLGSWEYDVENDTFLFNDLFYAIFKTTAEQVGGYTMKSEDYAKRFVHPDDVGLIGLETTKAIETDDPNFSRQLEHRTIFPDGKTGYITVRFFVVKNEKGKTVRTFGVNQDITERKLAEDTIVRERLLMRTLIDNLPDPIYFMDKNCRKVIANIADVKNIGYNSEDEILGKTDIELFPGKTGRRGHEDNEKIISSGKAIIGREEDFVDNKGMRRWLETTKIPLKDKDGKIVGMVGIGHDITERKRAELELIKAKDKAEESDRLKTAFLHNISHEIRTPMNAIVGFSTLLGEPDIDAQSRMDYIEVIMQSSNHLLSIISDIIDISNIEANIVKISKNSININSVLKSLCDRSQPEAEKKKIELICETGVPDSDALIITDSTKLTQILFNLVSNAIKFTDKGYVKIGCELIDRFLEFQVSDTGIGITEEYHQRIFDRFYQVKYSVSRLYEGTGLGLAISKANVELMGGKIWLTSEPGTGTTFYFTIPYEKQPIAEKSKVDKLVPETLVFKEKKKILVAEDNDSNFMLIQYFLSGTNVEIIRAKNGKEAVELALTTKDIDFILMDIKMPVMDGYSAVKLIREKNITVPIIAQTAYAEDREMAIESGFSCYISKPFNKKQLLDAVRSVLTDAVH